MLRDQTKYRAALAVFCLLLVPMAISFALYWKVVAVDGGWLEAADDQIIIESIRNDLRASSLLALHGLHFVPAMKLTYLVLYILFGTWWTPYGVLLVFTHGLLAASVGIFVYRFSRSLPAALAVTIPYVTSWSLSSGVLTSFVYAPIYVVGSLMLLSAVLVDLFVKRRSIGYALLIFLAVLWASFTIISGTPIYMIVGMFYVGLKLAELRSGTVGSGIAGLLDIKGLLAGIKRLIDRRDVVFCGLVLLSVALYALVYGYVLSSVGWKLPTEMEMCQEDVPLPLVDRLLYVLSFGYVGTFMLSGVLYLPVSFGEWRFVAAGVTAAGIVAALGVVLASSAIGVAGRSAAVAIAACLIMAVLTAAMVTTGRSCVQLWHMRYSFYTVTFITCAAGVLFGLILKALPRWISPILAVALLVVSVNLGHDNYVFVQTSSWLVNRKPGFLVGSERRAAPPAEPADSAPRLPLTAQAPPVDHSAVIRRSTLHR